MFQFLIILIAIAIVAVAWVIIHFIGKALDKRAQRQAEKEKEEKAIFEAKVEEIKMRYLAEDKVVNLDEIEEEIRGKETSKIADFFKMIWSKIVWFFRDSKVMTAIYKGIGIFFHYLLWPFAWLKKKTYDKLRYDQQKVFISVLFILPTIIGFLLFFLYPLIMSFIYSLSTLELAQGGPIIHFGKAFTIDAIQDKNYTTPDPNVTSIFFNYIYALRENVDFPVQLWNTVQTTVIDTVVITIFSLLIAVLLNGDFKGRGFVRAIFFLPVIFNSEAISEALESASSLSTLASQDSANALSQLFDLKTFLIELKMPAFLVTFLSSITSAIYRTISYSGIQILIFLAAIQSVPKHLYEAAKIEGATAYEAFWKITLPMVSPMMIPVIVYTIVDSFLRSDINDIIDLQFKQSAYGRHAAMSWIYLIASLLILAAFVGIVSTFVFYYDEKK